MRSCDRLLGLDRVTRPATHDPLHAAARHLHAEAGELARDPASSPVRPLRLEPDHELGHEFAEGADSREARWRVTLEIPAPVRDRLTRDGERCGGVGDRQAVPSGMPQDLEAFVSPVVGATLGRDPLHATLEQSVLGAKALELLLEDRDLPGQGAASTDRGSPVVVRERDHAGDRDQGLMHAGIVERLRWPGAKPA